MLDIFCPQCRRPYLVGTRSIVAFANTSDGPVARVRCPGGHVIERVFHQYPVEATALSA